MEYFLKHLSKRITAAAANAVKQDDSIKSSRDERTAFSPLCSPLPHSDGTKYHIENVIPNQ